MGNPIAEGFDGIQPQPSPNAWVNVYLTHSAPELLCSRPLLLSLALK